MQKRDGDKSKRLTKAQWQALSDEWEISELRQAEFCKLKGVNLKTFINWRQKVLREKDQAQKLFLPVHVKGPVAQQLTIQGMVVKLVNGMTLQIPLNANKTFLNIVFELLGIIPC